MQSQSIELYKIFIDDLVQLRSCVLSRWIVGNGWPQTADNEKINKVLDELTAEQKEVIASIVQEARDNGIHDVLASLTDQINVDGLELVKNGVTLASEPFDTPMHFDWVCRKEGDPWPDQNG